jgi:NAD-dependent deacetylase
LVTAPCPAALVEALRRARSVVVLTGAGASKESGISTFRDADGLWAQFDPDEVATPAAFRRDPGRVWRWYALRRAQMATSEPNAGHLALAALERHAPEFALITQNIDGLHRRAGSRTVIELHGNIERVKCSVEDTVCDLPAWPHPEPPPCPACGAPLRPDVVWFGEMLPVAALTAAVNAAQHADVFLSVGTSGTVEPAASLPFEALRRGAVVVEINPEWTPLSPVATYRLVGAAGDRLPPLVEATWPASAPA